MLSLSICNTELVKVAEDPPRLLGAHLAREARSLFPGCSCSGIAEYWSPLYVTSELLFILFGPLHNNYMVMLSMNMIGSCFTFRRAWAHFEDMTSAFSSRKKVRIWFTDEYLTAEMSLRLIVLSETSVSYVRVMQMGISHLVRRTDASVSSGVAEYPIASVRKCERRKELGLTCVAALATYRSEKKKLFTTIYASPASATLLLMVMLILLYSYEYHFG